MAKRKSESQVRPGRSPASSHAKTRSARKVVSNPAGGPTLDALEEAIEDERARLMQAHSLLSCIALAIDNDDGGDRHGPYYPGLIEIVRDLVNESIRRLDWDQLERLVATGSGKGQSE